MSNSVVVKQPVVKRDFVDELKSYAKVYKTNDLSRKDSNRVRIVIVIYI